MIIHNKFRMFTGGGVAVETRSSTERVHEWIVPHTFSLRRPTVTP